MENIKSTNITEMCISNQTNIVNLIQKEQNIIEFIKANDDIKIQYFIWYEKNELFFCLLGFNLCCIVKKYI